MRTRLLKPEFFRNEELSALPVEAQLLFAGLWCIADREGRLRDRPLVIAADLFPARVGVTSSMVDGWLGDLCDAGFIHRYEVEGKRFLCVRNFATHQKIHPNEASSDIPPPPSTKGASRSHHRRESSPPEERVNRSDSSSTSTSTTTPPTPPSGGPLASLARVSGSKRKRGGELPASADPEAFERFWARYWRRQGKGAARDAWLKLDHGQRERALVEVVRQAPGYTARPLGKRPHAATWLNQQRWEDEPESNAHAPPASESGGYGRKEFWDCAKCGEAHACPPDEFHRGAA